MIDIIYKKGDVRYPTCDGNKIICHCCNDINIMGAGVALAIRKKWPVVYSEYKDKKLLLGEVQYVKVEKDIVVANMIGQEGIGFKNGIPPIRYEAMDECLSKVSEVAKKHNATVCIPYLMGSALAGGEWNKVEALIIKNLCTKDVKVQVYEL